MNHPYYLIEYTLTKTSNSKQVIVNRKVMTSGDLEDLKIWCKKNRMRLKYRYL